MVVSVNERIDKLEERIVALEMALQQIRRKDGRVLESSLPGHSSWYQDDEEPIRLLPGGPAQSGPQWVSKSVRITEQLTSFEFGVKTQLGQAALFGLGGTIAGAGAVWLFELPWYASPVIGLTSGTLALLILLIDHRGLVHQVVKDAGAAKNKHSAELRVQVNQGNERGAVTGADFLYVAGITPDQLRLFAQMVRGGASLAFHAQAGGGKLFSQPQYSALMSELERFDYVRPASGNKPRALTAKGRALMRALAGE